MHNVTVNIEDTITIQLRGGEENTTDEGTATQIGTRRYFQLFYFLFRSSSYKKQVPRNATQATPSVVIQRKRGV
jgi:hypothetical protein